jgi:hypothetical protein
LIQAASNPAELIKVAAAKSAAIPKWSPTWSHIRILMPSQERAFVLWARSLAYNRSVLLAIAAERFRLQQGRWPTNAEELAPDYLKTIPDDPFTGHPMVFIHSNDGVTAYSVGENGADDGGLVEPLGGERLARDFGFHLPAPEKRGSIVQQHESEKE